MTQIVGISGNDVGERHGSDIEQSAVEVEILESKQVANAESAPVILDDQFAIVMLHAFIVGNRVILEGAQHDDNERSDQRDGGDITGVEARDRSYYPAPGQGVLRNAGKALSGQLRFGLGHPAPSNLMRRLSQQFGQTRAQSLGRLASRFLAHLSALLRKSLRLFQKFLAGWPVVERLYFAQLVQSKIVGINTGGAVDHRRMIWSISFRHLRKRCIECAFRFRPFLCQYGPEA